MNLDDYFKLPDSPSKGSPVGKLMTRILAEFPWMTRQECRMRCRDALLGVGGPTRLNLAYRRLIHAINAKKGAKE